jgi:hypothetical protein
MTQRVMVKVRNKELAYLWKGLQPLAIGDRVLVPAPYWAPDRQLVPEWEGTVTALETDYEGSLVSIRERAMSMIPLTAAELKILVQARDLLYAKLVPGQSHYKVERAHEAVLDVMRNGVLDTEDKT